MITLIKSGLLDTVQDLGRYGYQKYGVITAGAMDMFAHRIANLLVGNAETEATLEITLLGPTLEFQEDALISICGGNLAPVIDGEPVGMWRPVLVQKGSVLRFNQAKTGCRAYLAVAGGILVPEVMDSKSTYLRAGIGGFMGRALDAGDELPAGMPSDASRQLQGQLQVQKNQNGKKFMQAGWTVAFPYLSTSRFKQRIRVTRGRQYDWFSEESRQQFISGIFTIKPQSDRMGYRLDGPELKLDAPSEMISEAVNFGSIQIPSGGSPIILLADRQTTGGYPKIAEATAIDQPHLAQMKPGDKLQFEFISQNEAQQLYLDQETIIQDLKRSILLKARGK